MAILEVLINCDGAPWNRFDNSFLGFIVIVTGRGDYYVFSDLPIDIFNHCKLILSSIDGGGYHGPCGGSFFSYHWELTFETPDSFVSKHRLLWSIIISIHHESQFMIIIIFLSTCNKLTSSKSNKLSTDCHINLIRELNCTILNDNSFQNWSSLIYK